MFTGLSAFPLPQSLPAAWMKRVLAIFFPVLQTLGLILWASWGQPEATPI